MQQTISKTNLEQLIKQLKQLKREFDNKYHSLSDLFALECKQITNFVSDETSYCDFTIIIRAGKFTSEHELFLNATIASVESLLTKAGVYSVFNLNVDSNIELVEWRYSCNLEIADKKTAQTIPKPDKIRASQSKVRIKPFSKAHHNSSSKAGS